MEAQNVILFLIALAFMALIITIIYLMHLVGYFYTVTVGTGPSVVSELKIAYKYHVGNYDQSDGHLSEVTELFPSLRGIAVYYDDRNKVAPELGRYIVGVILCEGQSSDPDPDVVKKLEADDFNFIDFPKVDFSVKSSHPFSMLTSQRSAWNKAYPKMNEYIKREKLCAYPFMEIYDGDIIHYMVPLSKQIDFHVEETKED